LHVDQNEYYGGSNGALSLQEVESWVERIRSNELSSSSPFRDASVDRELEDNTREESLEIQATQSAKLSLSRAYTLSLSPFIIYTRSNLLPALVSSKTHQQLEFQVVGSWWVYERSQQATNHSSGSGQEKRDKTGVFRRVPNGREDVFSDKRIDLKAKRQLMKFLKFVVEYENQLEVWDEYRQQPFPAFLQSQFDLPSNLHAPLLALTLSLETPQNTLTSFAIPRIARHLRSIGKFGPGFGAVVPKWGGASEIAQVACRACAVGGGIYMLGQGIQHCSTIPVPSDSSTGQGKQEKRSRKQVHLANGESLQTRVFISTADQVPSTDSASFQSGPLLSRNVSIISTPLPSLLPALVEGSPLPAVAVVVFPSGSLLENDDHPPVYIMVHSSETGECPVDQCKSL
jgi:RAB protein geranylgeranyltransferase component A